MFEQTMADLKHANTPKSTVYRRKSGSDPMPALPSLAQPYNTTIEVVNEDCMDSCHWFRENYGEEAKIALLNMCSEFCPGGGVVKGSNAQEEAICRQTSLYPSLKQIQMQGGYPLSPLTVIYTENVKIFKDCAGKRCKRCIVDVFSMAALRRPRLQNGGYQPEDYQLMMHKCDTLLHSMALKGATHLVLGAWGCGAFCNPPDKVAEIFKHLLETSYKGRFQFVAFAIYEDKGSYLNDSFTKVFKG